MAKIIGDPGRNTFEESVKRSRRMLLYACISFVIVGMGIGQLIQNHSVSSFAWAALITAIGVFLFYKSDSVLRRYEKERQKWRKGMEGEVFVSDILRDLPGDFVVVNDITKRFGNIDHVVVGPTGIYVINTKNWRGSVASNNDGELLLNGRATDHLEVHNLIHAVMNLREKIMTLCDLRETECFVQGLMVFTASYLDHLDTVGHIKCLREDHLLDHLRNPKYANRIRKDKIQVVGRALEQLARMDPKY